MPAMLCRAHVPVLAAWGASDWLSSREDHLLLAACANEGKAGLGSFVEIQGADHYFAARAFEAESFAAGDAGRVCPAVAETTVSWLETRIHRTQTRP